MLARIRGKESDDNDSEEESYGEVQESEQAENECDRADTAFEETSLELCEHCETLPYTVCYWQILKNAYRETFMMCVYVNYAVVTHHSL